MVHCFNGLKGIETRLKRLVQYWQIISLQELFLKFKGHSQQEHRNGFSIFTTIELAWFEQVGKIWHAVSLFCGFFSSSLQQRKKSKMKKHEYDHENEHKMKVNMDTDMDMDT